MPTVERALKVAQAVEHATGFAKQGLLSLRTAEAHKLLEVLESYRFILSLWPVIKT